MADKIRISWLDVLKGICILFVIIGHIVSKNSLICIFIYSFHIPLFFVISGYLLRCRNVINNRQYTLKRAKKILYPYYTLSLLMLLIYSIYSLVFGIELNFVNFIVNILIMNGFFATWFLPCLFFSEQLFFITNSAKHSVVLEILIICIAFVLSLSVKMIPAGFINAIVARILTIIVRIMIGNFFIYIGYNFNNVENLFKRSKLETIAMVLIFIIGVVVGIVNGQVDMYFLEFGMHVYYIISSVFCSVSLLSLFKKVDVKSSLLEYIGKNSLTIMATHMVFVMLFNNFTTKNHFLNIILVFIVEIIIVFIVNNYLKFLVDYSIIFNKRCGSNAK